MFSEILHKIGFDWHLALFHTINFLIVFLVLVKYAFPKMQKVVSERRSKIESGLKNFEDSQAILKQSKDDASEVLSHAHGERKSILAKAAQEASEALKLAESEKSEILAKAKSEAETIVKDSYNKGSEELGAKLPEILKIISEKAFLGKVTPEVNNSFIQSVFKDQYGK